MSHDDYQEMPENEEDEEDEEEDKILCISKEMLPCKLLFFVVSISFSALMSFLSLFYISSGITVSQLGLMNGIAGGFSMIIQPMWGALVDSAIKHRAFLVVFLSLGSTVLEFGKPWLIMLVSETKTVVKCFDNSTNATDIAFNHSGKVNASSNCSITEVLLNPDTIFLAAAVNSVLSRVILSGMMTCLEGAVIKTVFSRKKQHAYGEQKVLGPIGIAIGSFGAGVAVDHYKPHHMSSYLAAFYIYLPLSLLQIPLLYILTKQAKWDDRDTTKKENRSELFKHVKTAFMKTENLMFLVSSFVAGLTSSIYGDYLFLFINDVMSPSKTVMSLTTVVASISELFVYPFSSKLIKLFGGHMTCIITCMLMYSIRLAGVSFCKSAWYVLPFQLLHGISSALSWTAMIEHTWRIFPKEITNMAIGVLYTFNMTGTGIISSIAGGILYHKFGGARLFQGMAIISCAWCVVMFFYFVIRRKPLSVSRKVLTVQSGYSQHIDVNEE